MKTILLLSVLIGTTFAQTRFTGGFIDGIGNAMKQGFDLTNSAVKLGTSMTGNAAQYGTDIGKMGVAAGTSLSSQGLDEGVNIGKDALNIVNTVAGIIPGASYPTKQITQLGSMGLDLGNKLGQTGIKATYDLGNAGLDLTNKLTQIASGTMENWSAASTGLANQAVDATMGAFNNFFNTGSNAVKPLVPSGGNLNPRPIPVNPIIPPPATQAPATQQPGTQPPAETTATPKRFTDKVYDFFG